MNILSFQDLSMYGKILCKLNKLDYSEIAADKFNLIRKLFQIKELNLPLLKLNGLQKFIMINNQLNLDCINKFKNLESLTIISDLNLKKGETNELLLPKLKMLSVNLNESEIKVNQQLIIIDCANLESIKLDTLRTFKFQKPLSIEYLQIDDFEDEISIFKNLKYLEFHYLSKFDLNLLSFLNQLKKFKIKEFIISSLDIDYILIHNTILGIKSYYKDLQILNINDMIKIEEAIQKNELIFYLYNYKLIDYLDWFNVINYNELIYLTNNQIPEDFSIKLNITTINITNQIDDQDKLIKFIRTCENLTNINIKNSNLNQQFYDELSKISTNSKLIINKEESKINLNFTNEFENTNVTQLVI